MSSTRLRPLRIGMYGGGTVGGGVYEIIMDRLGNNSLNNNSNSRVRPLVITKICVESLSRCRSFHVHDDVTQLVTDMNSILEDDSIDLVVEVMDHNNDNLDLAWTIVQQSLQRGKSVITSNQALIAHHLDDIRALVITYNQSNRQKVQFAYEAAVCGGIPIIHTLQTCYTGDIIHQVMGICNGTTNYVLEKMEKFGAEYEDALKEAIDLGYADADPTADMEGYDVQAKMAILAKLAFGTTVPLDQISCRGISQLTSVDFEYTQLLGCTIQLVGTATRLSQYGEHDGPLSVYVSPKVISRSHLLARGSNNSSRNNTVAIDSANLGIASYTGPGAGRFPTAGSVVADICRIANQYHNTGSLVDPFPLQSKIQLDSDYTSEFYIRISFSDALGIVRCIGELSEKHSISIDSILQNPIKDKLMADFVVTTEECRLQQVQDFCHDIAHEDFVRCDPLFMPMLR